MMKWVLIAELVIRLLELQQGRGKGKKLEIAELPDFAKLLGLNGKDARELVIALPRIERMIIRLNKLFK